MVVPKAFLPVGDSSFVWGVMIGREGSSPKEMRDLQDRADELIRQDPAVAATFTMTGNNQFLSSNQGLLLAFLKSPDNRAPIQEVAGDLMGKLSEIPGVMPFMRAASGSRDQHRRDESKPGAIRLHRIRGESKSKCMTWPRGSWRSSESIRGS